MQLAASPPLEKSAAVGLDAQTTWLWEKARFPRGAPLAFTALTEHLPER